MIEVVEPGALTSVQTAEGRTGWRHLGVPVGGAADAWSARLANRLVGNADDAPVLEITLVGPTLQFSSATSVALAGAAFHATLDGIALPMCVGRPVRGGTTLRIGDGDGARASLAVAGGITVEHVLGSAATDLGTGFGGHEGRALRVGDRLEFGSPTSGLRRWTGSLPSGPIRILRGPHHDRLAGNALLASRWVVSTAADRTGVRLEGPLLRATVPEVASMGLPLGAIQVPPDGKPIVMLADRPVTGGYPVPACVIRADIGRVARLLPGDALQFASVSVKEALAAYRGMEDELAALEDANAAPDDDLGWAGALE